MNSDMNALDKDFVVEAVTPSSMTWCWDWSSDWMHTGGHEFSSSYQVQHTHTCCTVHYATYENTVLIPFKLHITVNLQLSHDTKRTRKAWQYSVLAIVSIIMFLESYAVSKMSTPTNLNNLTLCTNNHRQVV